MADLVLAWGWHGLTPTILSDKSESTESTSQRRGPGELPGTLSARVRSGNAPGVATAAKYSWPTRHGLRTSRGELCSNFWLHGTSETLACANTPQKCLQFSLNGPLDRCGGDRLGDFQIFAWPARTAADVGRGGRIAAALRLRRAPSRGLLHLKSISSKVGSTRGGGDGALDGLAAAHLARQV